MELVSCFDFDFRIFNMKASSLKQGAALVSVFSNTALVIAKLLIGLAIGSVSVISEAIHSAVDLLASIIAFFAVRKSDQPADEHHAFGHGKFENLSGVIEAVLIFAAAGWIIYEAIHKLLKPIALDNPGYGIIVMAASAIANIAVSRMLFRVGIKTDSIALKADAWHLMTDVYTSAGVMAGLILIWLGEKIFIGTHFHWIDPVAAILVALLIIKAAWKLTLESVSDLLDQSLPPEEEQWIRRRIDSMRPRVHDFHHLRSRKSGSTRFVEFHIVVDAAMSVGQSHDLNDTLVSEIKSRFPDSKIMIHIEPNTCQ